jgi:hypothetical protein
MRKTIFVASLHPGWRKGGRGDGGGVGGGVNDGKIMRTQGHSPLLEIYLGTQGRPYTVKKLAKLQR